MDNHARLSTPNNRFAPTAIRMVAHFIGATKSRSFRLLFDVDMANYSSSTFVIIDNDCQISRFCL